ncbi:UNVERIFIED_ORG: hypothetical protein J2X74_006105 [Bacillus sp. 1751]|nr:hypothetical protein [Bacillus sp. 1751]
MDIFMYLLDLPFIKELVIGLIVNVLWHLIMTYKVTIKIEKK